MQTTPKPIPTKSPRKTKTAARFLLDWAAVIALALCFIAFTLIKGSRFMSFNNMINILRAMSSRRAASTWPRTSLPIASGALTKCSTLP